jgi:hypothetical protein
MPRQTTLNGSQAIRDYLAQNPSIKPRFVQAALKAKGVIVTSSLVSAIKGQLKTTGLFANPVGRPKPGGVNKSQVIRDYMKQHPAAMPKKIHAAMKARGVLVSMTLVNVLNNARRMGTAEPFAKSGGVSLSQAVREFLTQNPGADPKAIVAAMKSKGLTISLSLAYAIKFGRKGKGATKKAVGRPKAGVTRSQAIRDFMAQNPSAGPSEIRKGLRAKGIVVTDSLVGAIKYAKKGKKATKTAGRPVGRPRGASSNGQLRVEDLLAAKAFVDRVGGVSPARKAIEILAQLA